MTLSVDLDPNDPEDAKIMRRQQKVAHRAGREGRDRDKVTHGRADLQQAYDEGAKAAADEAAAQPPAESTDETPPPKQQPAQQPRTTVAPAAAPPAKRGRPLWRRAQRVGRSVGPAHTMSGLMLGVLLYAPFISYIRYGPTGPKDWLKAKFLNRPAQGSDAQGGAPTKTTASAKDLSA